VIPSTPVEGSRPFVAGERVLFVDDKDRRYLVKLRAGADFQTHSGVIDHDAVIGLEEGSTVTTRRKESAGREVLAVRPTLADLVVKMPRGAQVIYPKDLATILLLADLFPGARVLEAGVGSGALSMAALRAGCSIVGYELREDFAERAKANVTDLLGEDVKYEVKIRDVYDGIDERGLDRILFDLPEPWRAVPHAAVALRPGGILLAYLPTINQTAELRHALAAYPFALAETTEVLVRSWHVTRRSVRPDHRMVAHTGFLTTARRSMAAFDAAGEEDHGESTVE
jgi:tRNA (adenine57-N1/adenine58-N1)-methyltransferase